MKEAPDIIILVKEKEKRLPKENDIFVSGGGLHTAHFDFKDDSHICYTRHDIKVPDGAVYMQNEFIREHGPCHVNLPLISLPQPKKFKWQYKTTSYGKAATVTIDEPMSEIEAAKWVPGLKLEKVPE